MPPRFEPQFSDAVLAYHQGKYAEALRSLADGLNAKPPPTEFLELQALIYRAMKKDDEAATLYRRLIALGSPNRVPSPAIAPYAFELGLIELKQKKYAGARRHFHQALGFGFNRAASYFFLGVADFREEKWEPATANFKAAVDEQTPEVSPAAHVYLAQLANRNDDPPAMVGHFITARRLASRQLASTQGSEDLRLQAQQVIQSVDTFLGSVAQPRFFGNVTLLTGYDSNVFSTPTAAITTPNGATGSKSIGQILKLGLGYASSPTGDLQAVPAYRGSLNLQSSGDAKAGQFIVHDFSTHLTLMPLALTSYGLKLQGMWIFQYLSTTGGGGAFKPYSLLGSFGPYVKHELGRRWSLSAELFFQPEKNFLDPNVIDDLKKSGWEQSLRISLRRDARYGLWNPGVSLTENFARTDGREFRSKTLGVGVDNTLYFAQRMSLGLSVALAAASFDSREGPVRTDAIGIVRSTLVVELMTAFYLNADAQFIGNGSSIPDYGFTRLVGAAGLSYVF